MAYLFSFAAACVFAFYSTFVGFWLNAAIFVGIWVGGAWLLQLAVLVLLLLLGMLAAVLEALTSPSSRRR